jgi:hypothetical protein
VSVGGTAPEEHDETPEQTIARLKQQLRQVRDARIRDEAEAAQLDTVLRAVALTRQDRDAASSTTLAGHREHLERIWADLEHLMGLTARLGIRLQMSQRDPEDPLVHRARRAIEQSRQALTDFAEQVNAA